MRQAKIDFNVDDTQSSLRMLLHRVREGAEPGKEPLKIDLASCGFTRQGFLKYEGGRDTLRLADVPFPGTIVFVRLPLREGDDQEAAVDIWG